MVEEKIVKINLRKRLINIPKWKRHAVFTRLVRDKLKNDKAKIAQNLNEKIWSSNTPKIRVKIVKDDKITKVELVE